MQQPLLMENYMNPDYTILIVDDLEDNLEILERHISKKNFQNIIG